MSDIDIYLKAFMIMYWDSKKQKLNLKIDKTTIYRAESNQNQIKSHL